MTKVGECAVTSCSYNNGGKCRTIAITVGDGAGAKCDTFCNLGLKGGFEDGIAGVGACKMSGCRHNHNLECFAPAVLVAMSGSHPDCMTFAPRH